MHSGLLVAHHDVTEVRVLLQRLADAGHIAVTKDAEDTGKERRFDPVPLNVLVLEKTDQGLRHGKSDGG